MAVSAQAMNQAWNTLVIRKTARTNPALLHYLLSKEDPHEEEDPELAAYMRGYEDPELESVEPVPEGRIALPSKPAKEFNLEPPLSYEDWLRQQGVRFASDSDSEEEALSIGAESTTPAGGPVGVREPVHQKPGDEDDDEDAGVAPVPKP